MTNPKIKETLAEQLQLLSKLSKAETRTIDELCHITSIMTTLAIHLLSFP